MYGLWGFSKKFMKIELKVYLLASMHYVHNMENMHFPHTFWKPLAHTISLPIWDLRGNCDYRKFWTIIKGVQTFMLIWANSEISGLYIKYTFHFICKNLICSQNYSLHSCQQETRVPVAPHTHKHLALSGFFLLVSFNHPNMCTCFIMPFH